MSAKAWEYGILLDLAAPGENTVALDLPAGTSVAAAAEILRVLFDMDPQANQVTLVVAGHETGSSSRERLSRILDHVTRGMGDGDGATLPGEPVHYELVLFRCQTCQQYVYRVHVDERSQPNCRHGHGPMELVR